MGTYLNPSSKKFQMSLNAEVYVDKSELLIHTNRLFNTNRRFICVSRPRRFGKTMATEMMSAYYGSDAHELFENLKIAQHSSYSEYLNHANVIMINIQVFLSKAETVEEMIDDIKFKIVREILTTYPEINLQLIGDFFDLLQEVYLLTSKSFVIIVDEWDCLFREYKDDLEAQKIYLDFLRLWLKDQEYVGLAYMTGILPIKKYGTQSALNMFKEYSMSNPSRFFEYFGFTSDEVEKLCHEYGMDFSEMKNWYNGYFIERGTPIYSPKSVVSALEDGLLDNYWNKTETFESLRDFINWNFDDLRDLVTLLIAGDSVSVADETFANDMTTFSSAEDILMLLMHLGYLSYNFADKTVRIPNEEVKHEFVRSMKTLKWQNVINALHASNKLLKAIWDFDSDAVAQGIEKVHEENTSILAYNDENSLSCILSLALFSAKDYYTVIRELPTGKGFSDLVFIPRKKYEDKSALLVELKWDKSALSAIDQIKAKNYISVLDEYLDNLLLVGINYDKKTKHHTCVIEKY